MDLGRCAACEQEFRKREQARQQRYCSEKKCQRERKRLWQLSQRKNDPDYKDNQSRAQRDWCERNPSYSREYRRRNPAYCERNRAQQRSRNRKRRADLIAKMDASAPPSPVLSGIYRMTPVAVAGVAKMDAWTVEITLLSSGFHPHADKGRADEQRLQREDVMG